MPAVEKSGNLVASPKWKFAVVVARFNDFITERLLDGALDAFVRHGGSEDNVDVVRVPGSFEIPQAASLAVKSGRYSAVVCIGAVIRGATPHFEYVAQQAARGIAAVAQNSSVPVAFGVLTCDTVEQAIERAGTKAGNKGADAMLSAIEMANLFAELSG
ncbi:MAG: 6,7-dimethyl-8-ribityllumazine synthase [Planctomycetes bacterium]|nr:6,7-dimethyl-8-ribityllumazine synthase [Planctomycetota bacterium]